MQIGGDTLKVGINIDRSVEEVEVLITAQEQSRTVNALYEHIVEFDKKSLETLTAYKDDIAKIVNVTDVFRIYTGNQKVYIQTHQGEYAIRYRLYELEAALDKKQFLRISNSEIVNIKKIRDIDLSIIGRICIRFEDNTQTYVSRRYIPKIKKSLGI
jgi:DNA-binding LytR/AlgR family response regulator